MEALALKSAGREIREAHSVVGASGGGPKCAGSYGNSKEKTKGVGTAGDGLAGKDNGAGISNWRVGGVISRGLGWTVRPGDLPDTPAPGIARARPPARPLRRRRLRG